MLLFKDIFTNDELCSDSYPRKVEEDGAILAFTGKQVTFKEGEVKLDGANASAEEESEECDSSTVSGVDIIIAHKLADMSSVWGTTSAFKDYLKEYMKKLIERLTTDGMAADEIAALKKKLQTWAGSLLKKDRFKNLAFFAGESEDAADGQLAILEYRDVDGVEKPTLMIVRAGIYEEKF